MDDAAPKDRGAYSQLKRKRDPSRESRELLKSHWSKNTVVGISAPEDRGAKSSEELSRVADELRDAGVQIEGDAKRRRRPVKSR